MLAVQVFDSTSFNYMLADLTHKLMPENGGGGGRFTTDRNGFSSLEMPFLPMPIVEAFGVYTWPGLPHVVVTDGGGRVVWDGRLEDIAIVEGGVRLTAFGYQRAYRDVPYTGLWSKTGSGGWVALATPVYTAPRPELFEMDNNNRLYWALRTGETYVSGVRGAWGFSTPPGGQRKVTNVAFDYSVTMPTNWRLRVFQTDDYSSGTSTTVVTGNGGSQTGSYALTLGTPRNYIVMFIDNNTGGDYTMAGTYTGDYFTRLTNIRIKTTTASTVLAGDIVAAIGDYVDGINTAQVNYDNFLIEATTTDLRDELYEDEYPADIFDRLATLHDYEWGVYDDRLLHFRARGSGGASWYVDATRIINLQRSLEEVRNSAYGVYRDANGDLQRTDVAEDTASQTRYGVIRRGSLNVQTTSETEAETHRDTYLDDRADRSARAEIHFARLHTPSGEERPLYYVRAGDVITIRNLSPSLGDAVDRIRTFVVGETSYDMATGEISIAPDDPVPSLTRLVARRDAGVR